MWYLISFANFNKRTQEAFGDNGQMNSFHDSLKEQYTLIDFFLDGNRRKNGKNFQNMTN